MLQDTVVIEGEVSLINQIDGDPDVVIAEGGGIVPSGTIEITDNGTYNVTDYAQADVDVQGGITPTGTKQISIASNGTVTEDVTNYANAEITTNVPASAVDTGTKSINSNGTHDVVGYANASVNVPNSYRAGDEGKVVSNGALVAQTSDTVTANDTYDTTLINSLTVNVSEGGLPSSVLDHVTIVPTADITNSNKLTLNFHATDRYYLIGYCADDLTPPSSGTIFANGRRFKGINGTAPNNSNAGQVLRADGTTGTDNSWCSYTESTGVCLFPDSSYSVLKTGKTYEIWLFGLGDNANA